VITVVAGSLILGSLLLPWANEGAGRGVNFSPTKPADIAGVMGTQWGVPVLVIAAAIIALGLSMLAFGPHRLSILSGILVVGAGLALLGVALDAARTAMAWQYTPGLGIFVALLTGLLLVPIGVASGAVGLLLRRQPTDPPAP
jgi:hypothetical protein